MNRPTRYKTFFVLAAIVLWVFVLSFYGPTAIIEKIGIHNGYILAFVMAVVGSITFLTTFTIYPALVTFAIGGLNPVILVAVSAVGLTLGDLFFYSFGYSARAFVSDKVKQRFSRFMQWLDRAPDGLVPFFLYVYVGFTPFPNNLLAGALAITGYPMKKFVWPDFFGNVTLPAVTVYLALKGVQLFG